THRPSPWVIKRSMPPGPLEGLLGNILSKAIVADNGDRHTEHQRLEPTDERHRRLRIPSAQAGQQHVIGDRGRGGPPDRHTSITGPASPWISPIRRIHADAPATVNGTDGLPAGQRSAASTDGPT